MNIKNKALSDFINYFFSEMLVRGFLFVSLPLLTIILTPEDYGKLSLIQSAITIMYVFLGLNLQNSVFNTYMKSPVGFGSFLFSNLVAISVFQLIALLLAPLYIDSLGEVFGLTSYDMVLVIVISCMLTYLYSYTIYLQASVQSKKYAKYNITIKLVEVLFIFVFALLLTSEQYLSKAYAQIVITGVALVFVFKRLSKIIEIKFSIKYVLSSIAFSVPLIPHVLSNSLLTQVDRFILNHNINATAVGLYSFGYNLSLILLVIVMAWNSSWQPRMYKLLDDNNTKEIKQTIIKVANFIIAISSLVILFGSEVIVVFFSDSYSSSATIFPVLVMANTLTYLTVTFSNFIFYMKKSIFISLSTLTALIVNVYLNVKFIPIWGVEAAAWSTLVSYVLLSVMYYMAAKKSCAEVPVGLIFIFKFIGMLLGVYYFNYYIVSHFDLLLALVIKLFVVVLFMVLTYVRILKTRS
ncbi:lipopolysaccharide biosynthesis protein [Photobacterium kagoshimensis]|uniref:lipopolysaccharide biosynthesis protein n=1 Tax=Photobacterium kagoshimensis TaxID=2910242 RepID=UPI003D130966